jgi:carbamoyltransferase
MYTLGINAAFHDSSACLVCDGHVVAAAEEERFSRIKHGKRPVPFSAWELPYAAIDFCLASAGIRLADVAHVAYAFDPAIQLGHRIHQQSLPVPMRGVPPDDDAGEDPWEALRLAHIVHAPGHLVDGAPLRLRERFAGAREGRTFRWHFVEHHLAHAASAFLPSPFDDAAVLVLDGRGECTTTSYWLGHGARLEQLGCVEMPHSLGLLYEEVTDWLGFLRSSDEYKVMALASYAEPRMLDEFRAMVQLEDCGRYRLVAGQVAGRFGPPRDPRAPLEPRHFEIAASLQRVLEESVLSLSGWLRERSGARDMCLAGGVALNCVMNARLRDARIFDRVWVQPAAGDAGTALGAALHVDAAERGSASGRECMTHAYLGPAFDDPAIRRFLDESGCPYRVLDDVVEETAALLADGRVIGWFQGAMEFGPRALGARSVLASPIDPAMRDRLNALKDREDFRPVAPCVTEEAAPEWFALAGESPFMLFIADVLPHRAARIPAAVHVDGTARVQTVRSDQHPLLHALLEAFAARTGVPVLINTSFNTRGEPIVCTPRDAVECFWTSPLDALVIGSCLVEKPRAPSAS